MQHALAPRAVDDHATALPCDARRLARFHKRVRIARCPDLVERKRRLWPPERAIVLLVERPVGLDLAGGDGQDATLARIFTVVGRLVPLVAHDLVELPRQEHVPPRGILPPVEGGLGVVARRRRLARRNRRQKAVDARVQSLVGRGVARVALDHIRRPRRERVFPRLAFRPIGRRVWIRTRRGGASIRIVARERRAAVTERQLVDRRVASPDHRRLLHHQPRLAPRLRRVEPGVSAFNLPVHLYIDILDPTRITLPKRRFADSHPTVRGALKT